MAILNKLKQNKGFTLVELLIAMSLMVILMGALLMVFNTAQRTNIEANETNDKLNSSQQVIETVRKMTANAVALEVTQVTSLDDLPTTGLVTVNGVESNVSCITSLDNVIYLDKTPIANAESLYADTLSLTFKGGSSNKVLDCYIQADGTYYPVGVASASTPSESIFISSIASEDGITFTSMEGNSITIINGKDFAGLGGGAGGGGGGVPAPEPSTEPVTSELPTSEISTEPVTSEPPTEPPTSEAPTEPVTSESPTEPPTETPTEPVTEAPSGSGSGSTWLPGDSSGIVTGLSEATENNSSYAAFDDINGGETFDEVVKVGKNESFTINLSGPSKVIVYICADDNAFTKGDVTATLDGAEIGREALGGRKEATADNALVFEVDASGSIVINPEYKALLYKIEVIPK